MKNNIKTAASLSPVLREAVFAALPMLRAATGLNPVLKPAEADAKTSCKIVLGGSDITADAVKSAVAALVPGDGFDALIDCGDDGAVVASFASLSPRPGRLYGKAAIVTGAAQGFGAGIAEALVSEGASVVIADLNAEGAEKMADTLCQKYGSDVAVSSAVNVADEVSVENMVHDAVYAFGGLDILVNNAGIVRAGSLPEMQKNAFELVLSVNYTAYFLCVKHSVVPMKAARAVCPERTADIIEINSKSGLAGSNKNFAYAGSKFGGIGLTQSFALELAEYGIKVNAVCPGNFLDGPLWSDPEKGLFVQYLKAGKVPGAKTVNDVRKFYEAKVPMGRGCRIEDVVRAIYYIVEQQYETGQAVPVTGGQQMLK